MKIINWKRLDIADTPHKLDARRLYDYDNAQAVHIYILEGVVDVRVGDETISVKKDNLVESPKDIVHCLSNSSGNLSRILVVKSPKPTSKAKLL